MKNLSRRHFALAGSLALGAATPTKASAQINTPATPPRDVGRKFNLDGTVKAFEGNTFIGHLGQQGDDFRSFDALLNLYREFPKYAFAQKIALTPPSSYHITVFGGLNEPDRGTAKWPTGVPADLSMEAANQAYVKKLKALPKMRDPVFEFVMGDAPAWMTEGAPHIPLKPANDDTARRLADLRNILSQLTGIRRADHDSYHYHVTFGYITQHLNPTEAMALQAATAGCMKGLAGLPRKLRIQAVQFCVLKDMYAFQVLEQL